MRPEILDIVNSMKPITLGEMKDVKLMNRVDTKYLVTSNELLAILKGIHEHYYAQEVEGNRLSPYSTVYYDTPELTMYTIHHDRHLVRDKVRVRTYVDSHLTFCEVKHKTNKGRTKKKRIEVQPGIDITKDPDTAAFLAEKQPYPVESLSPNLETAFDRFTLVNYEKTERLTIDCNLVFNNFVSGTTASMDDLVIMELKQDGRARSLLKEVLFDLRIKPYKISKYCIGTAMTRPEVKQNRFKKKIRRINKLKSISNIA
ncbi:MAG: polyphosphate polymerase domain-containing protein [Bacteroidales bacterium]|nr:polyphosphate polymerase domain-containing protein [Bacteroidales bacterium]